MTRPRSADDFAAIRARLVELRLQRDQASADGDARPVTELPLDLQRSGSALSGKPGIPGWRVSRKRVFSG
jgi:hypothetical protein